MMGHHRYDGAQGSTGRVEPSEGSPCNGTAGEGGAGRKGEASPGVPVLLRGDTQTILPPVMAALHSHCP